MKSRQPKQQEKTIAEPLATGSPELRVSDGSLGDIQDPSLIRAIGACFQRAAVVANTTSDTKYQQSKPLSAGLAVVQYPTNKIE